MQTPPDPASVELTLTPAEVEQFRDALLSAFSIGELEQVVYFGLEEDIDALVDRGPTRQMVADLVKWASRNNKVPALLAQARRDNPGNVKLRQFEEYLKAKGGARAGPGPTSAAPVEPTVAIQWNMPCIPTAYYEVLDPAVYPLLTCTITPGSTTRRVRVSAVVEGYSAQAVETMEVGPQSGPLAVKLKPILSPEAVANIVEIRAASVNVRADVLGGGELDQRTQRVWLLARTSAPLAALNPDGTWQDMSQFLGTFVTPKQPAIQAYLRKVAAGLGAPLSGYHGDDVEAQVRAVYETLKEDTKLVYVQSSVEVNPEAGVRMQHVRLPREVLERGEANCADGSVLFASLLLAFGLQPALVILPEHIIVAWEAAAGSGKWQYLDIAKIDTHDYDMAQKFGQAEGESYETKARETGDESWFRRWPLKQLREELKIFPVE